VSDERREGESGVGCCLISIFVQNKIKVKYFLLLIPILFLSCKQPVEYSGNPVFPGWYADPEAIVANGEYWIFPTYSAPYDKQVFFDAFSSKDLVTWEKHPRIIDTSSVKWAKRAMWAPSVIENNGKWYLFFGANDIQNDNENGGIGVAVSDSPSGPYRDYLGKPLIGKFQNGAQPIDQFAFRNSDGVVYLIYGGWRHCNIVRLKDDFTGIEPFSDSTFFKEITPAGYVEGPFMFIRNGKYYFMWSEGGWTGPDYSVAYAVSDSPFGPFERVGKILRQDTTIATGAGHHSVIHLPGTDQYYIVYHRRPLNETDRNSREVCIDLMEFDDRYMIKPVVMTNTGVRKAGSPGKE
jgi:beta-xylosidase